jgi:hypothetical protein
VANTAWEFLPAGAIIAEADDDAGTAATPSESNPLQIDVDGDATADDRCVVFRPTGALSGTSNTIYVTIVEGFYDGSNAQLRNADNTFDIEINPFTGRIKVVSP